MGTLLSLLVFVLIIGLIYWVITLIPLPPPFKTIVLIIFAVIVIFMLLGMLTGVGGLSFPVFK